MSATASLSCAEFVELVDSYLDGDLDQAVVDELELHEVGCAGCCGYRRQARITKELLAAQRRRGSDRAVRDAPGVAPEVALTAYKFLSTRAVGPFSGFRWPVGAWVRAEEPHGACRSGIHACSAADLPHWLNEELWRAELAGPVQEHAHKLVAPAGRLVERVAAWNEALAQRFAEDCGAEAARLADPAEASVRQASAETCEALLAAPPFVAAANVSALSAFVARRLRGVEADAAERARQARWLEQELGL